MESYTKCPPVPVRTGNFIVGQCAKASRWLSGQQSHCG